MVAQLPQRRWSNIAYGGGMTAPTYPVSPNRVQSFPMQGNSAMARLQEMMQAGEAPVPQMAPQQAVGAPQMAAQGGGVGGGDIISALGYGLASGDMGAGSRLLLAQKAAAREQAAQQSQLASAISWLDQQDPRLGQAARANPAMIDDLMKQAMEPREYKAPEIFEYNDPETGLKRKGYMTPQGVVPVGGTEAPEPEEPNVIEIFDEKTGQPRKMLFYPKSKRMEPLGGVRAPSDQISLEVGPDGTTRYTVGGSGGKPLTEGQAKNATFATNATYANSQLTPQMETAMTDIKSTVGGALLSNWGLEAYGQSQDYQNGTLYAQTFINAVARNESGAQISDQEYSRYAKTFIPQPGNTPETIARKREARKVAITALEAGLPKDAVERIGIAVATGSMSTEQAIAEVTQGGNQATLAAGQGPRRTAADGLGEALQGTITIPGTGQKIPWREVR